MPGLVNSICDRFQSRHVAIRHSINENNSGESHPVVVYGTVTDDKTKEEYYTVSSDAGSHKRPPDEIRSKFLSGPVSRKTRKPFGSVKPLQNLEPYDYRAVLFTYS